MFLNFRCALGSQLVCSRPRTLDFDRPAETTLGSLDEPVRRRCCWGSAGELSETAGMYERFTDRARKVMQLANQEAHASTTSILARNIFFLASSKKVPASLPTSLRTSTSICVRFGWKSKRSCNRGRTWWRWASCRKRRAQKSDRVFD